MQRDAIDDLAAEAFEGFVVRKDLALRFKGQYPVPTYVGEFLLGRYCATTDEKEIAEGLEVVERLMGERTVRAGEEELFKARAREMGHVKIIDLITARLDQKSDSYLATLPSLQLKDCRIDWDIIRSHERMLTGGFYAEVELEYDALIAEQKNGRAVRHHQCAADPDVYARRSGAPGRWPQVVHDRAVEVAAAAQRRP